MSTVKALSTRDALTQRFSAMELWTVEKHQDYGDFSRWQFTCDEHVVEIIFTATGRVRQATVFEKSPAEDNGTPQFGYVITLYTGTRNKANILTRWLEHLNYVHVRMEFPNKQELHDSLDNILRNTENRN